MFVKKLVRAADARDYKIVIGRTPSSLVKKLVRAADARDAARDSDDRGWLVQAIAGLRPEWYAKELA